MLKDTWGKGQLNIFLIKILKCIPVNNSKTKQIKKNIILTQFLSIAVTIQQ